MKTLSFAEYLNEAKETQEYNYSENHIKIGVDPKTLPNMTISFKKRASGAYGFTAVYPDGNQRVESPPNIMFVRRNSIDADVKKIMDLGLIINIKNKNTKYASLRTAITAIRNFFDTWTNPKIK